MKCKFCFAELDEDAICCTQCGKMQNEQEEMQPKKKDTQKLLLLIGVVLLALALIGTLLYFLVIKPDGDDSEKGKNGEDTTAATDVTGTNGRVDAPQESDSEKGGVFEKITYTATNEEVAAAADSVVATLGNHTLTNGELQVHYWMNVYEFLNQYGSYLSYIGLDISKPLDEQIYDQETGKTYQQHFLESAIDTWKRYVILAQMAEDAGFRYSTEQQEQVDNLSASLQEMATEYKYASVEEFLEKELAPGITQENYTDYYKVSWKAMCYFDKLYEEMMPTADEIEAYYTAHETDFVQKKHSKTDGYYYDVRHILVAIEGTATDGVYTDAQWAACLAKAQKMLNEFLANNPTEEAFANLAIQNSADPGSASNGGLYDNLTKNYGFIANFENWYIDESRKVGDTGIVQNTQSSTQGYHIMYLSGKEPIWQREAKYAALNEKVNAMLKDAESKWTVTVQYDKVLLCHQVLTAS